MKRKLRSAFWTGVLVAGLGAQAFHSYSQAGRIEDLERDCLATDGVLNEKIRTFKSLMADVEILEDDIRSLKQSGPRQGSSDGRPGR